MKEFYVLNVTIILPLTKQNIPKASLWFYMRALQKAIQYPHRKIQIKSYPQRGGS